MTGDSFFLLLFEEEYFAHCKRNRSRLNVLKDALEHLYGGILLSNFMTLISIDRTLNILFGYIAYNPVPLKKLTTKGKSQSKQTGC